MNHKIVPSHVAVLVPSVRKAAEFLRQFDFQIHKEEEWEGEGTREIYVEREKGNSLLLVQPIKAGSYQKALEKRGPSIHHLAIDVLNLEEYLISLTGTGWYIHPASIKTIKDVKTAYLARPGFPGLVEVQQKEKLWDDPLFVKKISLPLESGLHGLIKHIGLENIIKTTGDDIEFLLNDKKVSLKDLL